MIGIRADANEEIATGHIMRCITIARELKKKGEKVLFFTADSYGTDMLCKADMDYVCLNTCWNRMEEELPVLQKEMRKADCHKILVDSYQATPEYLEILKTSCKIIYIDDMFENIYPADMIINYNAYHVQFPYKDTYGKDTGLLLGTSYVPLREEFSADGADAIEDRQAMAVLLSCGGGDTYNVMAGVLTEAAARKQLAGVQFHVVVGRFNRNKEELEALAALNEDIVLHYDVANMAELMKECEAAISAAGTVLYELCAMQVPTVFFVCADNQKHDSDFFASEERMLFAGDIRTDRTDCIEKIGNHLERLVQDSLLRNKMRKKLGEVTDGHGAERIAESIIKL